MASTGGDEQEELDEPVSWDLVKADIESLVGPDADIKIYQGSNHIDVRVIPQNIKHELEAKYEELNVVPYRGFKMTISRDEAETKSD